MGEFYLRSQNRSLRGTLFGQICSNLAGIILIECIEMCFIALCYLALHGTKQQINPIIKKQINNSNNQHNFNKGNNNSIRVWGIRPKKRRPGKTLSTISYGIGLVGPGRPWSEPLPMGVSKSQLALVGHRCLARDSFRLLGWIQGRGC